MQQNRNFSIAGAMAVVFMLTFLASSARRSPEKSSPSFTLLVALIFTDESYKQQFLRDFAPLAAYVHKHEPSTIAYEALQSDKNPLHVLILERYIDKEVAYLKVHRSSQPFLDFRPKLQKMQEEGHVTIEGQSYFDLKLGFGSRG
jgi:quinol monooxygenase YgiN